MKEGCIFKVGIAAWGERKGMLSGLGGGNGFGTRGMFLCGEGGIAFGEARKGSEREGSDEVFD